MSEEELQTTHYTSDMIPQTPSYVYIYIYMSGL